MELKSQSKNNSRRNFIKNATAAAAGFYIVPRHVLGRGYVAPSDKLVIAGIGAGGKGESDIQSFFESGKADIAILCDVDDRQAVASRQRFPKAKYYKDFREMLDKEHKNIDACSVSIPDHNHAVAAMAAMQLGKHVYVQKPISTDVIEGEAMLAAARKYNRVVQVGTQRRSTPHLIEAKKNIVEAGLLGKISHIDMCCYYHMRNNGNPPVQAVPDFFDYEMWTGPAPMRPFDGLPHVRWWRTFMEYGNGIMGDMCIHMFDAVRWMLNLGWPKSVVSTGGIYVDKTGKSNIADTQTAVFEYDGLNCVWQHRSWGTPADPDYPWSFKIYGEKGTLCGSTMKYDFIPADEKDKKIHGDVLYEKEKYPEDLKEPDIELNAAPATRGQMINFLEAIDKGGKPVADIEQGHISTASCIIANLSMQLGGRPLSYDHAKREITGDAEATKLLKRPYRQRWIHPDPDKV